MKQATVNTFGALGYSSVIIQWFWVVLSIGLPLFMSDFSKQLFLPAERPSDTDYMQPLQLSLPGPIEIVIAILSVIFALGIIGYALVAVPRAIGRSGQRITDRGAKAALPHLAHRQHLNKRQKRRLVERITWSIKLLAILVPVALLAIPPTESLGLSQAVVVGAGVIFAVVSLVLFSLQFILARIWRLPAKQVW